MDLDGDGWGDAAHSVQACERPSGTVAIPGDCDDSTDTTHPTAPEICNDRIDNNCDSSEKPCGLSAVRDLRKSRQIEIRGADSEDYFGIRVAGVGDLDGDGADEFVVASQARESESSLFTPGAVYLFWGGSDTTDTFTGLTHDIDRPLQTSFTTDDAGLTDEGTIDDQLDIESSHSMTTTMMDTMILLSRLPDLVSVVAGYFCIEGTPCAHWAHPLKLMARICVLWRHRCRTCGRCEWGWICGLVGRSSKAGVDLSTDTSGFAQEKSGRVYLVTGLIESNLSLKDMEFSLGGSDVDVDTGRNISGSCDINGDGTQDLLVSGKTGTETGGAKSGIIFLLQMTLRVPVTIPFWTLRMHRLSAWVPVPPRAQPSPAVMSMEMDMTTSSPLVQIIQMDGIRGCSVWWKTVWHEPFSIHRRLDITRLRTRPSSRPNSGDKIQHQWGHVGRWPTCT